MTQKENLEQKNLGKATFMLLAFSLVLSAIGFILFKSSKSYHHFDQEIFIAGLAIGLIAQLVDGALGMAYGVTATTFMLASGIPPAVASGSVHIAEVFTTGASGLSHWRAGNINKALLKSLVIPGVIGGVIGALLITSINGKLVRPWISGYLLIMGFYILIKAFKKISFRAAIDGKKIRPLALFGGFVDALGGGGWGPVVTTTLLGSGHEPKKTIGSVNASEFFVTIATGFSFAVLIGVTYWEIVAGLIISGMCVAPFAAKLTAKLPPKILLVFVGVLIMLLSALNLYQSFI